MPFEPTYVLKDIAEQIRIMPLHGVQFVSATDWGDPQDMNIIVYNLESESSVSISPITRKKDDGSLVSIAYQLDATLYIPHNTVFVLDSFPEFFLGTDRLTYTVVFLFGSATAYSDPPHNTPDIINSTGGVQLQITSRTLRYVKEFESVEYRPRMIIKINGIIKLQEVRWLESN